MSSAISPLPESAIGFKEWAFVCDALTQGVQSLILRNGGILEGRGGFEFKHRAFSLFPTSFHTQRERLRWVPPQASEHGYSSDPGYDPATLTFAPEETRQRVDIDGFCTLEQVWRVTDWEKVAALAGLHVWNEDVVRERFVYDEESCLNVALVRLAGAAVGWSGSAGASRYRRGGGGLAGRRREDARHSRLAAIKNALAPAKGCQGAELCKC